MQWNVGSLEEKLEKLRWSSIKKISLFLHCTSSDKCRAAVSVFQHPPPIEYWKKRPSCEDMTEEKYLKWAPSQVRFTLDWIMLWLFFSLPLLPFYMRTSISQGCLLRHFYKRLCKWWPWWVRFFLLWSLMCGEDNLLPIHNKKRRKNKTRCPKKCDIFTGYIFYACTHYTKSTIISLRFIPDKFTTTMILVMFCDPCLKKLWI